MVIDSLIGLLTQSVTWYGRAGEMYRGRNVPKAKLLDPPKSIGLILCESCNVGAPDWDSANPSHHSQLCWILVFFFARLSPPPPMASTMSSFIFYQWPVFTSKNRKGDAWFRIEDYCFNGVVQRYREVRYRKRKDVLKHMPDRAPHVRALGLRTSHTIKYLLILKIIVLNLISMRSPGCALVGVCAGPQLSQLWLCAKQEFGGGDPFTNGMVFSTLGDLDR